MEYWGLVVVALTAGVLTVSERRMARANAGVRMPAWRRPRVRPGRVIALRALGAGLAALGAVGAAAGPGTAAVLILVAWLPGLVVHTAHNRRVAGAGRPELT